MTHSPGTTPESLAPAAAPIPQGVDPEAQLSFTAPQDVEFPALTASDDAPVSVFGTMVQSDVDADLLDVKISHVREVRYLPGQGSRETIPTEMNTPAAILAQPVPAAPARARRSRAVLVLLVVGIAVILGVVAALLLVR
jgi:hypothetical protein